ncbi:MAG: class I SAM-dependent methyltransferase [Acidimicrobiales bacterium]
MATMSRFEAAWCRSRPWRFFASRIVLPWALQGVRPTGDVLEIGAGSGAMAAALLAGHPQIRMTVTDFDPAMVAAAAQRLAPFADRVTTGQADATSLPYDDNTFDMVLSWIMLHHTMEWEKALAEAVRATRHDGFVVGYDLLNNAASRALHGAETAHARMMRLNELRETVRSLPIRQSILTPGLGGNVVRFTLCT